MDESVTHGITLEVKPFLVQGLIIPSLRCLENSRIPLVQDQYFPTQKELRTFWFGSIPSEEEEVREE
jgi:hypothetical protein